MLKKTEASSGCVSNRGKTFQSGSLVREFRENLVKLGHLQNFLNPWRKPHYLHSAAFFDDAHVISDKLSDPRTIKVFQPSQIQYDIGLPALKQSLNHLLERP